MIRILLLLFFILNNTALADDSFYPPKSATISVKTNSNGTSNPFLPPENNIVVQDVIELDMQKKAPSSKNEKDNKSDDVKIKTVYSKVPSFEAKIENWYVMKAIIKNRNVCYLVKYPDEQISNHKESRKPYIIISFVNGNRYEVSISAGYRYRSNSTIALSVDGAIFKLFANNNLAWTQGVFEDFNIIQAMGNSFRAMVKSESFVGTYAVDVYDLIGFNDAYNKMVSVCKK